MKFRKNYFNGEGLPNTTNEHLPYIFRSPKSYYSYENINCKPQFLKQSRAISWEALNTTDTDGKILIGLNYINSGRFARLPIAQGTRRILERGGLEKVINSRHIEQIQEIKLKDENENHVKIEWVFCNFNYFFVLTIKLYEIRIFHTDFYSYFFESHNCDWNKFDIQNSFTKNLWLDWDFCGFWRGRFIDYDWFFQNFVK